MGVRQSSSRGPILRMIEAAGARAACASVVLIMGAEFQVSQQL